VFGCAAGGGVVGCPAGGGVVACPAGGGVVVFGAVSLVAVPGFVVGVSFLQPDNIKAATTTTAIAVRTTFLIFTPFHKTVSSSISLMRRRVIVLRHRENTALDAAKPRRGPSLPHPAGEIK
jgi:hypothetical protein